MNETLRRINRELMNIYNTIPRNGTSQLTPDEQAEHEDAFQKLTAIDLTVADLMDAYQDLLHNC